MCWCRSFVWNVVSSWQHVRKARCRCFGGPRIWLQGVVFFVDGVCRACVQAILQCSVREGGGQVCAAALSCGGVGCVVLGFTLFLFSL